MAVLMIGRPYHLDPGLNHAILEEFQILGYPVLSIRSIPKDEEYLSKYFAEDLEGIITSPAEIGDVWPENYSSNSAMKVWACSSPPTPNVVVLDLSSFKCGHDAPTGIIDSIIGTAQTPVSAMHDIDANKPGGSIKIRVKTYATPAWSCTRSGWRTSTPRRASCSTASTERLELLGLKKAQLAERSQKDPSVEQQIEQLTEKVACQGSPRRQDRAENRPPRPPKR